MLLSSFFQVITIIDILYSNQPNLPRTIMQGRMNLEAINTDAHNLCFSKTVI